jgi:UDP-4-amino-4,6-dideoxy-N-acetyl-beta-L-altrosamine transaminase
VPPSSDHDERPFLPYGRQTVDDDDVRAVVEALRSPWITQGPRVEAFERALCEVTGARHAVAVSSGTAALHCAYAAIGLGPGDEIVTSPNTFLATANAAVYLGARPRFADLEPRRHNLDPERVEGQINDRTRAVVAVDFAGHAAEYDRLREICDRRGLRLIADASHSLGGTYRRRRVGTLGDLSCLSFHPVKGITSGEGGAVLTDDGGLAGACRRFRNHGLVRDPEHLAWPDGPWSYEMNEPGFNYRITDVQCALGASQLRKLGGFIERRRQLAASYAKRLAGLADVELPGEDESVRSAWHLYVVQVPAARRRDVFERLRARNIGVQVHYIPVYRQPYYRRLLGLEYAGFPETERYYAGCISLPLFPTLTEAEQQRVADELREALAAGGAR